MDGLDWSGRGGGGVANTFPIKIKICRNKLQIELQHSEMRALRYVQGLRNWQRRRKVVEKFVVKATRLMIEERIKENTF
jgi:hypothetical protein